MKAFDPVVRTVAARLREHGLRLVTAESCTGGMVAAACTELAGSSDWFERGFVTYSNAAKSELLDVDPALILSHGAVSREVVVAMAQGALIRSQAQLAVAVTGIAGPGGGCPDKPVGTVWLALAERTGTEFTQTQATHDIEAMRSAVLVPHREPQVLHLQLAGNRSAVRAQTVLRALQLVADRAGAWARVKH
jgi:nicotinamide-nucleotide amidase